MRSSELAYLAAACLFAGVFTSTSAIATTDDPLDIAAPRIVSKAKNLDPQWSVRFMHWQDSPPGTHTIDQNGDVKRFGVGIRAPNGLFIGGGVDVTTPPFVGIPRNGRDTSRVEGQLGYEWSSDPDMVWGAYLHAGWLNGRATRWMNRMVLEMHHMAGEHAQRLSPPSTDKETILMAGSARAAYRVLVVPSGYGPLAFDASAHVKVGVDRSEVGAEVSISFGSDSPFVPDVIGLPVAAPADRIVPYASIGLDYVTADIETRYMGTKKERGSASVGVRAELFSAGVTFYSSPTKGYRGTPNPLYNIGGSVKW